MSAAERAETIGGHRPQAAGLEVVEGLLELVAGVHDERPVLGDRFGDRDTREHHQLGRPCSRGPQQAAEAEITASAVTLGRSKFVGWLEALLA